ncbi:MAG: pirin family protein [Nitrospiria bacterium]
MNSIRKIGQILKAMPVIEGAGVHLKRVFGHPEIPHFDPFLLLDDFHSRNPNDYMAGFPWHPHRGIETITYMIHGAVSHRDSLGNSGVIQGGDIQWMTAGSGIIHEEMPRRAENELWGFQLWANLPASHKMMAPRYRNIREKEIPVVSPQNNVTIKIICGEVDGIKGPVQKIITDPEYLDITVGPETELDLSVKKDHTVFAYIIKGKGYFDKQCQQLITSEELALFEPGEIIRVKTIEEGVRFLLISGKPIQEPIAWRGPIVMNHQEELVTAFQDYQNGTFSKG